MQTTYVVDFNSVILSVKYLWISFNKGRSKPQTNSFAINRSCDNQ